MVAQKISFSSNGYVNNFEKIDTLFLTEYEGARPSRTTDTNLAKKLLPFRGSFGYVSKKSSDAKIANTEFANFKKRFVTPFYVYADGTLEAPTSTLFFKPKNASTVNKDFDMYGQVTKDSLFEGFYDLQLNTDMYDDGDKIFTLCDSLYKIGIAQTIEPVFVRRTKVNTDDPLFPGQWNITNTGQTGGTPGADMKVENVWSMGYLGTGINVAVIDLGIDLNHPDLQSNLLTGYDATGNGSAGGPQYDLNNTHGTNCAGIIAAVQNNIGGVGVAYNSRIIPIRIGIADQTGSFYASDAQKANCFSYAVNNGADIISCSWGGGSASTQVDAAIANAVQNGRSGKGALVLFATGNANSTVIQYPSSNPNAIAVGASSPCDERKSPTSCDGENWGGNYGIGLDLIAPGVRITTTTLPTAGSYANAYTTTFNGTSAATPNAAAVLALILSANPDLTGTQARQILESTCDKVGGYNYQTNVSGQANGTWSTEAGYGRVNACVAVTKSIQSHLSISGPDQFCTSGSYSVSNLPIGASVAWSSSDVSIATIGSTGNASKVTSTGGNTIITATITTSCSSVVVSKTVAVGGPKVTILGADASNCEISINYSATGNPTSYNFYTYRYDTQAGYQTNSTGHFDISSSGAGTYKIGVTGTNSCGTGPESYMLVNVSCSGSEHKFVVSPNPASNVINVSLSLETTKSLGSNTSKSSASDFNITQVNLYDQSGNLKRQQRFANSNTNAQLNISGLGKGIYFVEIVTKISKEKQSIIVK